MSNIDSNCLPAKSPLLKSDITDKNVTSKHES